MNTEEKAKAYNEALEKVKPLYEQAKRDGNPIWSTYEYLIPELRESEDEKIRKWIFNLVNNMSFENLTASECAKNEEWKKKVLAYLAKQKEQNDIPLMNGDADLYFDNWIQHNDTTKRGCFEEGIRYAQRLQKEQKQTSFNEHYNPYDLCPVLGIDDCEVITEGNVTSLKKKKQKPAEWSEVELEFRGEKVKVKRPFYRDDKGRGYSTAELDEEVAWNALRAWCEKKGISLYDLYPKAEWNEEDADILNCCISSIEEAKENRYAYKETDGDTSYDREIAFLKSLRPSWKPSEEQMDALNALNCHGDLSYVGQQNQLISLYNDLKKLM